MDIEKIIAALLAQLEDQEDVKLTYTIEKAA